MTTTPGSDADEAEAAGAGLDTGYDATPYLPPRGGLPAHRKTVTDCRGCPLFGPATRAVFGDGPATARIVLVGEQPEDQGDRQVAPFVGPAGRLLRKAVEETGLAGEPVYLINAVKHFRFVERGKRRIHEAPSLRKETACQPRLAAEMRLLRPEVVVALGATAGRALFGTSFRVTKERGRPLHLPGYEKARAVATLHPSSVLRSDDRRSAYAGLVADLRVAADPPARTGAARVSPT
ncbi:UdgX family uracil-DNA binding protein [Actinacidiphila sp. ITFR-21]|uniref:UdgX family uracil-DNA binding protein n=1 Tax=Actinacidiphila sp. ITFR-21 TaxID=3075199 RepID=UPI00288B673A|nr:UdgX family uracil-DNA binding protein [Streptomyces sp. ITFR-21]WNI15601.1 UdgX family uracil-DNA binding protein [Streptomyces sp. ITFR-21]